MNGKIVIDADSLPEGTCVTAFVQDDGESIGLSPADEAELFERVEEVRQGRGISAAQLLKDIT